MRNVGVGWGGIRLSPLPAGSLSLFRVIFKAVMVCIIFVAEHFQLVAGNKPKDHPVFRWCDYASDIVFTYLIFVFVHR